MSTSTEPETVASALTIAWPVVPGAATYRLARRLNSESRAETIYRGDQITFDIRGSGSDVAPCRYEYRVEVTLDDQQPFWTHIPFAVFPNHRTDDESIRLNAPPEDRTSVWRVVVYDDTLERTALDHVLFAGAYNFPADLLVPGNKYRYRFLRWLAAERKWENAGSYLPLQGQEARVVVTAAERPGPANLGRSTSLMAFVTIDTEANMRLMRSPDPHLAIDHQVFGKCEGGEVGIAYFMDQLDRHGIKGTFFVDVLMEYQFGRVALERTIEAISARGHDIELHMHPSPNLMYSGDEALVDVCRKLARGAAPESFQRALDIAVDLFTRRVGRAPLAFRNGAYHIHDSYFEMLRAAGLRYDSTVYAFKNCAASPWIRGRTQPFEVVPGLWEIPVSWMVNTTGQGGESSVSQFVGRAGSAVTALTQAPKALAAVQGARAPSVVMMAHSYSYLSESRINDLAVSDAWNDRAKAFIPEKLWGDLLRTRKHECVFLEGISQNRIDSIEAQLAALMAIPHIRLLSFAELAADHSALMENTPAVFEPLAEYSRDGRQARLTAVRRYSETYLGQLFDKPSGQVTSV